MNLRLRLIRLRFSQGPRNLGIAESHIIDHSAFLMTQQDLIRSECNLGTSSLRHKYPAWGSLNLVKFAGWQASCEFLPGERLDVGACLCHRMQIALSVSQCSSRVTFPCKPYLPASPPHEVYWVLSPLGLPACKSSVAIPSVSLRLLCVGGEESQQLGTHR